jgi:hypothetical protein
VVNPECARAGGRRIARRPILLGLAGAALALPAAGLLAGCGSDGPDPLEALATRARADAQLIDQVRTGPAATSPLATQLAEAADARRSHAKALAVVLGDTDTDTANAPAPSDASVPSDTDDAVSSVRSALQSAEQEAAKLVPTLSRQRASLVGSVAACCAAYRAVLE